MGLTKRRISRDTKFQLTGKPAIAAILKLLPYLSQPTIDKYSKARESLLWRTERNPLSDNENFDFGEAEAEFDSANSNSENVFPLFGDESDSDESAGASSEKLETDPAVVAYHDQMSAEYNAQQEQFQAYYGFTHDCKCDKDYSSGNMVSVTECFAHMAEDALETCHRLNAENQMLRTMITSAMGLAISTTLEDEDGAGAVGDISPDPDPDTSGTEVL